MSNKTEKIITVVGMIVEVGCIAKLAFMALERNKDAYEAQMECINLELKNLAQDIEIYSLKREISELKGENSKEEEA